MGDNFVNEFLAKLNGKIPDGELETVARELQKFVGGYDISTRETALVPYEGDPMPYKAYMVTKKIEGRSDQTLNLYRIVITDMLHTIPKQIPDITANDLRIYLYTVKDQRKISDRTLDNRRLILNSFFGWCYQEGYTKSNPCAAISSIKYEEKPREPFSDMDMERIRDACRTDREKAIIETFYATGCRVSELRNLKKSDVDLITREVRLFGKGRKHRISYLNARAELAIKKYLKTRDDDSDYLFVRDRKPYDQLSNAGVEKILKKIGSRCGIEKVFPHRIRHTTATDALAHGMPITELQSLLGHNKLDTTMIYAKISQGNVQHDHKKYII